MRNQQVFNLNQSFGSILPDTPTIYTLELTTACDNNCSGCANIDLVERRKQKYSHGTMVKWKEILNKIIEENKNKNIIFRISGGEPTLHPDFIDIIDYIDNKNIKHVLFSTGKWIKLPSSEIIKFYSSLRNCLGFLISLHGSDYKIHDFFVESGKESFARTCTSIKKATSSGINVVTNTVINSKNYDQIEKITTLAEALGASRSVFNRFVGDEHYLQCNNFMLNHALATINTLRKKGRICSIGNGFPKCFAPFSRFPISSGYELCHISPEGLIRPDNLSTFSFGNILTAPIKTLWQSDKAKQYRQHLSTNCLKCAALPICRGGQKSPYFGQVGKFDSLIKKPLTKKEVELIPYEPEKETQEALALTSD